MSRVPVKLNNYGISFSLPVEQYALFRSRAMRRGVLSKQQYSYNMVYWIMFNCHESYNFVDMSPVASTNQVWFWKMWVTRALMHTQANMYRVTLSRSSPKERSHKTDDCRHDSLWVVQRGEVWKEQNARVFRHHHSATNAIIAKIKDEARAWCLSGAKELCNVILEE
jgi:hypothetical protein